MRDAMFRSKCPSCGNVDILSESETKKKVHCQRCYYQYLYKDDEKETDKDLVSLVLWSARRLPKVHGAFVYSELQKILGNSHEYSEYIKELSQE